MSAERSAPTSLSAPTLYALGGGLVVVALALLGWFLAVTAGGASLEHLVGKDWGRNLVAAPFVVLMIAAAPLFLAEYTRRGDWSSRARRGLRGGSNTVTLRPLRTWSRLLWLVVAIAAWAALIPVPLALVSGRDAFRPDDEFWMLLDAYGLFAAGMAGAIVGSLLKRASYDALARRGTVRRGSASQEFWRQVSHRFRLELVLAFAAGALVGLLPVVAADASAALWITVAAAACAVLALAGILSAWRSGEPLYRLESLT
ncbi:hypothetical protein [Leifsonia sp. AG29]|uniref:hypothetical protein n=1 Tax=Leifsonia sp. AG29 TaxID=2598860 RepID=UPI00131E1022|nr:hypothetical protein [Leifsonia sp. AG29]